MGVEDDITTVTIKELNEKAELKVEEFEDLLSKIEYASSETKKLWKEVYQNAVDDRARASLLFADICKSILGNEQGHVVHSRSVNDYLAKMNKANDQLLKLAELIENASDVSGDIDAEDVYNQIAAENESNKKK